MQIYLVGGAVRDSLLGLPVQERDYVVVGASVCQLLDLGFKQLDQNFPVFRHPQTKDEYALARREQKCGIGYKGFVVEAGADVTLEEDLMRRDLTINAIAQDANGRIIDPLHGQADLQARKLRHITPNFVEDPVRLLRIARFAGRFWHLGFRITHSTFKLLRQMASQAELISLLPQRLRDELLRALATNSPWRFLITLQRCGALQILLPEFTEAMGTTTPAHSTNTLSIPIAVLNRVTAITPNIAVRLAALIHAAIPDSTLALNICQKFNFEQNAIKLTSLGFTWPASYIATATPELLLKMLESTRLLQHPQYLNPLIELWQALEPTAAKVATTRITTALQAASIIKVKELLNCGLTGINLGTALREQRILAINKKLNSLTTNSTIHSNLYNT